MQSGIQHYIQCSAVESPWIRDFDVSVPVTTTGLRISYTLKQPVAENPSDDGFTSGPFTEKGARAINRLLAVAGVLEITAYERTLSIAIDQTLDGETLENTFLQIIKEQMFPETIFRTQLRTLVA